MTQGPITFLGELEKPREISIEMRDRFLEHYVEHQDEGCAGYHSCPQFRRMRERWAMERGGGLRVLSSSDPEDYEDPRPQTCPECGGAMVEKTNRKTQQGFWACDNYPVCRYTYKGDR